ncbi:hypothetical protein [Bartonella tamiae]|uniref:DUF883 domain-containing protein n=1 Tax=Bartonella tamiae Th239 TaxID=1094558 RepID=J0R7S6_9HYPH|nr:hypothetical protein [Bartonella tamiae]EJF91789.1 hypothetical protein ME5_00168 [Bartonella tamiae Th239]EJF92543.1 hypothetical protein MEG_01713 [Bartonella tamiae Th307]
MGIFQDNGSTTEKSKKRIDELKRELSTLTGESQWTDPNYHAGEAVGVMKEKGRQAIDHVSHHAHELKEKAKDNPKTLLAIIAGVGLAACLIMRKN